MDEKEISGLKRLHIGTSGWSYKHWYGVFYPGDIKPDRFLEYYISKFPCVELNSSFYHLPKKATITGWVKRTPDSFRFCPKLSRFITHRKRLANVKEALSNFFELFEEMKMRLGPVLIQLPPGLHFDEFLVKDFMNVLKEQYGEYRFAMEVRHKSWIADHFFQLLTQYGMAFVIADSEERFPYYEAVTSDFVYLRFHGHEKLYASDYSEMELQDYAGKITDWLKEDKEIWAFFNNDFHGYAIKNAENLRKMICSQNKPG